MVGVGLNKLMMKICS